MLETSQDILFITLATCAGILTFLICWGVYYIVMILKRANLVVSKVTSVVEKIDALVELVQDKMAKSADFIGMASVGFKYLMDFAKEKKASKVKDADFDS